MFYGSGGEGDKGLREKETHPYLELFYQIVV